MTLHAYFIQHAMTGLSPDRVAPFGNLRIKAYVPLPEAYRSLSRPSSPGVAKASTECTYVFDSSSGSDSGFTVFSLKLFEDAEYFLLLNCSVT